MSDPYDFWKSSLAGKNPSMSPDFPQCGFYRLRSKNKVGQINWRPVAYYPDERSNIRCVIGSDAVSVERGQEIWTFCGQYAVEEMAYREVTERGGNWPDEDPEVARQTSNVTVNSGATDDIDVLNDQITSAAAGKSKYLKITSKEQSEQAQSLRSRLLELAGQATKAKKKKADPLYKEWKDINAKWNPIIEEAESAAGVIKIANDRWLTEQLQAVRKAEAEAEESDMMAPEITAPTMPTRVAGAYGRAASVKPTWIIKKITDWDALYQHFKESAAVKEALEKLAKAGVKDGEVPGVEREEVARSK